MINVFLMDRLGWGFMFLGSGIVMLIIDVNKRPRRSLDAFMRSLVIMCIALGFCIILNEKIPHTAFFDEKAEPSLLAMTQSMI